MTSRQTRVLTVVTLAIFMVIVLTVTAEHWRGNDAVIPQQVVTPNWKPNETRPMFTSCVHARLAEAPLPLQVGAPGWNPRLDRDKNGLAC